MNLIQVENVTKRFSGHTALEEVSISVPEKSIFGLLGPNGAGKTTLIRIINMITAPDEGQILFGGLPIQPDDIEKIGYLPEERGLYKKMKVGEQALYLAQLKGMSRHDAQVALKLWFEKFDIGSWWNKKVEELSKGMQQKVQFIITVLHQPELLIFDEPFSGFDPINVNLLKQEILRLRDNGSTIIFSTHNMSSVEELCDNIALINRSRKILEGNVMDIRKKHRTETYEVEISGLNGMDLSLPPSCRILENTESGGHSVIKIQGFLDHKPNELLSQLIRQADVHAFREILPTMNDVFIATVNAAEK
ncbi:MAG: ATP-binding cassette domain-containing protein [Bacteroidales bacterium]|nr:ATP-binding cassette domain-containing protein [Bacteroidales bacterium]